jgi:hypothetical protein
MFPLLLLLLFLFLLLRRHYSRTQNFSSLMDFSQSAPLIDLFFQYVILHFNRRTPQL